VVIKRRKRRNQKEWKGKRKSLLYEIRLHKESGRDLAAQFVTPHIHKDIKNHKLKNQRKRKIRNFEELKSFNKV